MEAPAPRSAARFLLLALVLWIPCLGLPATAALSPAQRVCVDGLSRALDKIDRQVTRQIGRCLQSHAKGRPLDPTDPAVDTVEECAGADPRGRIARALDATRAHFEKRCSHPPGGQLEEPFPEFGATDAARVGAAALGLAPDLAHALFGPDLDAALATPRAPAKCQQAAWKAAVRCQQARSAAFRACQKGALAGGRTPAAEAREELRAACLGIGAEEQPDPRGRLAAQCGDPGSGIAKALAKACGGEDLGALLPGSAGEPDPAVWLGRQVACRVCRQLSAAGDLRRSCDLFDDGETNGSCGESSIRCESPADGAMLVAAPGAEIQVAGQVPDPGQFESVSVGGVPVALDAEGFFSHALTAEFGMHFVEIAALDDSGGEAKRVCSFLASESYAAEDVFLDDGLSLGLAQAGLDDGSGADELDSLGDVLRLVANSPELRNRLHTELLAANPLKPSSCDQEVLGACVLTSQVSYENSSIGGPNSASLDLVPGGLAAEALARQLSVTIRATGSAGPIPFNVTGTISTPSLEMSLGADLDLVGGAFEVSVPADAVSASIGTISVSINGVPQALTNLIVSLSQDTIRNRILDALRSYARDQLGALLADFVESLEIPPADLEVPRLGSAGSISLTLETAPSSVEVSDPRALFGFAVRASVVAEHDLPSLGVALPSGPILGDPGSGTPLAFAAQLGALNQILHALWRSGLLHDHVDGSIVAELPPGASAELEALLPPVVAGGDGQTGLVQLGALRVLLTYPGVFDTPVLLSVGAEASVTLATAGDSILLEDVEPVALHVSGVDAALTPIDQALANAIASEILQRLLEAALGAAAEGLSSPAFEPTGLVPFGIPAGSRLGLVDPALELTPTHLYLRGGFGVLEP